MFFINFALFPSEAKVVLGDVAADTLWKHAVRV